MAEPKPQDRLALDAIALAEHWQNRANELLNHEEKAIQKQLAHFMTHPSDKIVMTKMIDQSFRAKNPQRVADQINHILGRWGVPEFFSATDKLLMRLFLGVGRHFPHISVPRVIDKMREDTSHSVIPGEKEILSAHLAARKHEGVRMNINHLGEAVLGEDEARRRLENYLRVLEDPEIEYISVKISTIYSQIQSLAFESTVEVLVDRLTRLLRAARDNYFLREDGTRTPKFVNLDMEEYRDLEITVAAFIRTLEQEEFRRVSAGLALQAYLPDSYALQRELTAWARTRVAAGKSPIKIRIVKGANMEMEKVEAAHNNWPLAPYDNKLDVDANYKRMIEFGLEPENTKAAHLGVGSHNLFELAYAFRLAQENQVTAFFSFEMLEGMADHVRRAIQETAQEMVLYGPVATKDQFISAIAYLIRRLDENTAEDNFLRYAANLKVDSPPWRFLKEQFLASLGHKHLTGRKPHRTQDRNIETFSSTIGTLARGEFSNEPDTDFSLPANRRWAEAIREKWRKRPGDAPLNVPVVVAGREVFSDRPIKEGLDSAFPLEKVVAARCALANDQDVESAVAAAAADPDGWRTMSLNRRHEILTRVAVEIRKARGDLIGAAAADTGKLFTEADPEVSEAVDFLEYYPCAARTFYRLEGVRPRGLGVVVVISPWNFPLAIPCGGLAAALAAGNTVIFKPASAAILTAWMLCQCFWRAGVSRRTLQFLPCSGAETGRTLIRHPGVNAVILTGGTSTGLRILEDRPDVYLAAETGGKNATIVTAMSDRDQAIKNVVFSAFSNSGQKCSATSLLILEKEVYEDEHFQRQLVDAAKSFSTGPAWEFEHKMGALIGPPQGDLLQALTSLEPGETWALKPERIRDHPCLWTPGIKWNVQPGGYTHMTEFFGPVLAVMKADHLDQAVEIANQTGYGLTAGLESLDEREHHYWRERIQAGNLYINRGTTGAKVLRQPFGGRGKSALGAGFKVGGPNYAAQFLTFEEEGYPETGALTKEHPLLFLTQEWENKLDWGELPNLEPDLRKAIKAVKSYLYWMETEFSQSRDWFHLRGQDNLFRYQPRGRVLVRLHPDDGLFEDLAMIAAVLISGNQLTVSRPVELNNAAAGFLAGREGRRFLSGLDLIRQNDAEVAQTIPQVQLIRCAAPERVPPEVYREAARTGFYISRSRVLMEGRIELLQYFREQSLCYNYHRYGNLGERGLSRPN
ncbi:MAG: bifunctional proline dehydrogenase/L-glutamate gamma-semialdehyde dehydrogenase [Thermodesulfobacteriota bacterium]